MDKDNRLTYGRGGFWVTVSPANVWRYLVESVFGLGAADLGFKGV
ncbi:MAG: hypothetical protein Q4B88_02395 [Moraxella sp.]|nr:hypothetical protein [Moraxella sp.]